MTRSIPPIRQMKTHTSTRSPLLRGRSSGCSSCMRVALAHLVAQAQPLRAQAVPIDGLSHGDVARRIGAPAAAPAVVRGVRHQGAVIQRTTACGAIRYVLGLHAPSVLSITSQRVYTDAQGRSP